MLHQQLGKHLWDAKKGHYKEQQNHVKHNLLLINAFFQCMVQLTFRLQETVQKYTGFLSCDSIVLVVADEHAAEEVQKLSVLAPVS